MNCYFCYQPLFSFYQGTVEIMRHGVILRLVLESRLRHLRFWLICNITWNTNINKQTKKKHFSFEHIECGMCEETYRQAAFDLSLSPSQSHVVFIICVSVAPRMISHFERRFNMSHLELLEKCLQQLIVKRTSRVNRECQTSNSYSVNSLETREHHFFARSSEWPWVFLVISKQ